MKKTIYTISNGNGIGDRKVTDDSDNYREVSKFREILPQILASSAKNLLLLDLGLAVAFPTIVIPALRGIKNRAEDEFLTFNAVQASWFGK
jgi:hypothetical protein